MKTRKIRNTLVTGGLEYLGILQDIHLFIIPPTGRILGLHEESPSRRIAALLEALRQAGGIVLPLGDTSSLIAALIASLTMEEHHMVADRLIEAI
jgi:hypothetical protein